jgi:hypothetical protein
MSKRIFGLVSLVTVISMAAPVMADEISATRSTAVDTPAGSARSTQSAKTSTDGFGAKTEHASKVEQSTPNGYRADSVKQSQSTDGMGTTESSTSAKTTVAP